MFRNPFVGFSFSFLICVLGACKPDRKVPVTEAVQPSYYGSVKNIVERNCGGCHNGHAAGPMVLNTYAKLKHNAWMVDAVVSSGTMPPWMPDSGGVSLFNQRAISAQDKQTLHTWIEQGCNEGAFWYYNPSVKLFAGLENLSEIVLTAPKPLFVPASSGEQLLQLEIPFEFDSSFPVSAVEVQPKLLRSAHHALYKIKSEGMIEKTSAEEMLAADIFQDPDLVMVGGWVPGTGGDIRFPKGFGFNMPKRGKIVVEMHYAPNPKDADDNVEIHIFCSPEKIKRNCYFVGINAEDPGSNVEPNFDIPADTVISFTMEKTLQQNLTLVSMIPHMHLLGKIFTAIAIKPDGDTIPLIKIKKWDFSWQENYAINPLLPLPKGTRIIVKATYDNTVNNIINPNYPPKEVKAGGKTTDEMLLFILIATLGQNSDNHIFWNK